MSNMTGRERVLAAINHTEPDRVPIDLGGWQSGISYIAYQEVQKVLGINKKIRIEEICQGLGQVDEEILDHFNVDTRYIFPKASPVENPFMKKEDSFIDEWGITWYRPESSFYYDMIDFPLKDEDSIESLNLHKWPDPNNILCKENLLENLDAVNNKNKAIFTSLAGCFEQATYVRGMNQFYMDAYINPEYFEALLDKVLEIEMERYSQFFETVGEHLDVVEFWGDLGMQIGPMISPELYRTKIKPREKQLVDLVKKKTNAKACLHTCGACFDFIPDIIDAGYEVLNPIQTTAAGMEPAKLKREFGKDITFWGAIDTQHILPFGNVQEVKEEVQQKIDLLASDGGFILAPCHNIQASTPPQNVIALFEAAVEYGKY